MLEQGQLVVCLCVTCSRQQVKVISPRLTNMRRLWSGGAGAGAGGGAGARGRHSASKAAKSSARRREIKVCAVHGTVVTSR